MTRSCSTVIAADDHPIVLSGIRLALSGTSDFKLLAEAENGEATLAAIEKNIPDLLILDLWMGGNEGLDLLRRILARWPTIRVPVYSMNDEGSYGVRALRAGAAGYLMKSRGLDELLGALRDLAAGDCYLSSVLAAEVIGRGLHPEAHPAKPEVLATLTDREIQVLRLIGQGRTTGEIADGLGISVKTVGAHRENLKNKLSVGKSTVLTQMAVQLVHTHVI